MSVIYSVMLQLQESLGKDQLTKIDSKYFSHMTLSIEP